jgi:hypothetical protein
MPGAVNSKWKAAAREFTWQWFFPASTLTYVPDTHQRRRWHLHETQYRVALARAIRTAKLTKRVTAWIFRPRVSGCRFHGWESPPRLKKHHRVVGWP